MLTSYVLLCLCVLNVLEACYIRDCPENSLRSLDAQQQHRQCPRCGNGFGVCVGNDICCNPTTGCRIGGSITSVCKEENKVAVRCEMPSDVRRCRGGEGICITGHYCCHANGCLKDDKCKTTTELSKSHHQDGKQREMIHKLQALLNQWDSQSDDSSSSGTAAEDMQDTPPNASGEDAGPK